MADEKMYWLQKTNRCPTCDMLLGKPIRKAVYNGKQEDAVPIWQCKYCRINYIQYVSSNVVTAFPEISCKYLPSSEPAVAKRKEEEKGKNIKIDYFPDETNERLTVTGEITIKSGEKIKLDCEHGFRDFNLKCT